MKKRDLENFNFIKSKFDEAMPEIPLMLDERMIERKIISKEERKVIKMKTNNRKKFRAFASAAACLLLFFGLLFAVYQRNDMPPVIDTPAQIETFKNYDELNTMIDTLNNRAAQAKKILEASNLDGPQMGGGDNEAHTNSQITGVIDADTMVTD